MSAGVSPWQQLAGAGLNRQHVFALADLPPEIRQQIAAQDGETQLILLGHAGRLLWEKVQAAQRAQAVDAVAADPIDAYTVACVRRFFARQAPRVVYRILYPGAPSVGLQALGQLAGWHHAAPFMVGIDPQWGSWFAYRALIVAASDFPLSAPQTHAHPCAACSVPVCRTACPAAALQSSFDLAACTDFRLQPASPCATNCLARRACPLGRQHAYDESQMQHSYGRSLQALRRWRAGQAGCSDLSAVD